jgi:hypothetical protein
MPRNSHDLYSSYAQCGVTPDLLPEEAQTLARTLIGEAAYQDPKHDLHSLVVSDVAALYAMASPEPQE